MFHTETLTQEATAKTCRDTLISSILQSRTGDLKTRTAFTSKGPGINVNLVEKKKLSECTKRLRERGRLVLLTCWKWAMDVSQLGKVIRASRTHSTTNTKGNIAVAMIPFRIAAACISTRSVNGAARLRRAHLGRFQHRSELLLDIVCRH